MECGEPGQKQGVGGREGGAGVAKRGASGMREGIEEGGVFQHLWRACWSELEGRPLQHACWFNATLLDVSPGHALFAAFTPPSN